MTADKILEYNHLDEFDRAATAVQDQNLSQTDDKAIGDGWVYISRLDLSEV